MAGSKAPVIVADSNISSIETALRGKHCELRLYEDPDPDVVRQMLLDADCLLCRSTIKVDSSLLEGSSIHFVATATAGTDHFDLPYLESRNIALAAAAGSNARSVAEYLFNALYTLENRKGFEFRNATLGIIGVGNVGGQVLNIASGLGMDALLCDPPLKDKHGGDRYHSLEYVLANAHIISLHVPLTSEGLYPTYQMMNESRFDMMKEGAVFINTSRGAVVNEKDLLSALAAERFSALVLDVFDAEPAIDPRTAIAPDIATPHIAGHSHDGKLLGTQMVYDELCSYLGWETSWQHKAMLPTAETIDLGHSLVADRQELVGGLLKRVYDIVDDHNALMSIAQLKPDERASGFKSFRSNYHIRRECSAYKIILPHTATDVAADLEMLGFRVELLR
jgi:erythronate-4-phosphate dehydrogenase